MKAILMLALLAAGPVLSQTGEGSGTKPENGSVDTSKVYTFPDDLATFPGGRAEIDAFINEHVRYTEKTKKRKYRGKCYMKFVVDAEGIVRNVQVTRGIVDCPECEQEAIRLIQMMPKWIPGKIGGKAVKSYFIIPVNFELS